MSKKEAFIKEVLNLFVGETPEDVFSADALDFWNGLQMSKDNERPKFTENGKIVLKYMQANKEAFNNLFKAKDLGEGIGISSRTASGALRKLVTDGYAEKVAADPVVYALTALGTETNPDAE